MVSVGTQAASLEVKIASLKAKSYL